MSQHGLPNAHFAIVREPFEHSPGVYHCPLNVRRHDGTRTGHFIIGVGQTPELAKADALQQAQIAITGPAVVPDTQSAADGECPRCRTPLVPGKAFFSIHQIVRAGWDCPTKNATLQDCMKCPGCGYSETIEPRWPVIGHVHEHRDRRRPAAELEDIEIVAYIVRLCRGAGVTTATRILDDARKAFPGISEERLRHCAADAAERLLKQGGYDRPRSAYRPGRIA